MNRFWETKSLEELTPQEWEALCDGCGRCCLHKLQDEETDEVFYTRVACRVLDLETCRCRHYRQRQRLVPDCLVLQPGDLGVLAWLPASCAYRLRAEQRLLPPWHPLVSNDPQSVRAAGFAACRSAISEDTLRDPEDLESHIIPWPL